MEHRPKLYASSPNEGKVPQGKEPRRKEGPCHHSPVRLTGNLAIKQLSRFRTWRLKGDIWFGEN